MPTPAITISRIDSAARALRILPQLQTVYDQAVEVAASIQANIDGGDQVFGEAVNSIYSANERTQMLSMHNDIKALITKWTNNHGVLLSYGREPAAPIG